MDHREAGMVYVPEGFPTKDAFSNDNFNQFFDSSRGSTLSRVQNIPENDIYKSQETYKDVGSVWDMEPQSRYGGVRAWNDAPQGSVWSDAFDIGKRPTQNRATNVREDIKIPKQAMSHDWSVWKTIDTA